MKKKETVLYFLAVHHRHGINYYINRTNAGSSRELLKYVKENWDQEYPDRSTPKDEEIVEAYFGSETLEEYYECETITVGP